MAVSENIKAEEKQEIDVQLENGEIVPGELVKPEIKENGPTRAQMRNSKRMLRHRNAKIARIANNIKTKKQAQARKKLARKPSNFVKGAE